VASEQPARLDPVVEQALKHLISYIFRRRGFWGFRFERRDKTLKNPDNRAGAIHIFKHLKHHGHEWDPDLVRAWAIAHTWPQHDADELRVYADGVQSGIRYHTYPDPFGMDAIDQWREEAAGGK